MTTLALSSIASAVLVASVCLPANAAAATAGAVPAAATVATPAVSAGDACQPAWPSSSLQKKEAGTVEMLLLVTPDGSVSDSKIARSSGYRELDKTTLNTVARCKFVPAQLNGKPILSWMPFRHEWIPGRGTVPPIADMNSCAKPVYPKESLRKEQQGAVVLAYLIDVDGSVSDARIDRSSGFPLLDLAAQQGIEQCTFTPGMENGEPAKSWVKVKYVWTLDGPNAEQRQQALAQAREGAARGDAESAYKLGMLYIYAQGVQRDVSEGLKWTRQAADQGWAKAQEAMGIFAMQDPAGLGKKASPDEAAAWFGKAAAQGSATGQFLLGALLARQGKPDEAMPPLRQSAQQGQANAQAMLAVLLMHSRNPDDLPEAIDLLNQAAASNDRDAQITLAHAYETGYGVSQDYAQAAALYKKVAVEGNPAAQLALARLYEQGLGVSQDPVRARELRTLASSNKPGVRSDIQTRSQQ